jgi:hypothetical protein
MSNLIDKDALVAEIEKRRGMCDNHYGDYWNGCYNTFTDTLSFIDTLEVKEVNFKEYYHEFLQKEWFGNPHVRTISEMMVFTAKHFFELGLKAQKGEKV